ncbi:MAG: hypothetical protein KC449_01080 [Anaerolineales bacterium]|nr:hypothetical protein [Anaerolineales bacterium]MCA9979141.1 hypothetical protein [Anaerolineales bacterium]
MTFFDKNRMKNGRRVEEQVGISGHLSHQEYATTTARKVHLTNLPNDLGKKE